MRLKNPWFELLTLFTAVFWAGCAINTIINFVRDGPRDILPVVLVVTTFLFLALFFFRTSLYLGNLQERTRRMKNSSQAPVNRNVASD